MAISKQERSEEYQEIKEEEEGEDYSENEGSDPDYESGTGQSYSFLEETHVKFSNLSIKKKSKSGIIKDVEEMVMNEPEFDEKSFERAQNIIEGGQIEKLKVDQCKVYLRKHGLRLTGNKDTLIQRIKEHQEILNGEGEQKYPVSSFVLNCKGDACTGDVVMFEQNVYEMYNIASRSASGPPCGTRIVAGRIVKESYGVAKQQHTFTIEVLWSRGEKSLPPLHPLLIKGRNLYRLKTLRQRWEDEGERHKVLMEKHSRGSVARSDRDTRIQVKEKRKMLRANRALKASTSKLEIRPQHLGSSVNIKKVEPQPQQKTSLLVDAGNLATQTHKLGSSVVSGKPAMQPRQSGSLVGIGKLASEFQQLGSSVYSFKPVIHHQRSGEFFDCGKPAFQEPQQHKNQMQSNVHNQILRVWNQMGDRFYESYKQPDFCMDSHRSPINKKTYHRQPLTSMNHHRPMSPPPHRQSNMQLCRYHAQGKCHFGDNCKFLHELREECGQRRGESLYDNAHGQRKFRR